MENIIAQNITKLRNAQNSRKLEVNLTYSNLMLDIMKVLRSEGFIRGFSLKPKGINVFLKYLNKNATLNNIFLVSKPSRRVYFSKGDVLKKSPNKGTFILSTSKGILSSSAAVEKNLGGEVLFFIN